MNKMVPLMMPLALPDTSAGTSGITQQKKSYYTPFWSFWTNECHGAIYNTTDIPTYVDI